MRRLVQLLLLLAYHAPPSGADGRGADVQLWVAPATERVTLDTRPPAGGGVKAIDFAAQRGERERAVLALRCEGADLTNVTVSFTQLALVSPAAPDDEATSAAPLRLAAFRQGFLFVNRSGLVGLVNTTPSWQPDPLLPLTDYGCPLIPAAKTQPFLVELHVPPATAPGTYTATATVQGQRSGAAFTRSVPIRVTVWAIDLAPVSEPYTMSTVFNFIDNVCAPVNTNHSRSAPRFDDHPW